MTYFLGSHYLLKMNPLGFGACRGKRVPTGSTCLNSSYFDAWSLSWAEDGKKISKEVLKEFGLSKKEVRNIQAWADPKFDEQALGWVNSFANLDVLREYKGRFFPAEEEAMALSIYFEAADIPDFRAEFEPKSENMGTVGILEALNRSISESEEPEGRFLGYDLIGMEFGGAFHSFHCFDCSVGLKEKLGIELNANGLIPSDAQRKALLEYAEDQENGLPAVPWYLVKVKEAKL